MGKHWGSGIEGPGPPLEGVDLLPVVNAGFYMLFRSL